LREELGEGRGEGVVKEDQSTVTDPNLHNLIKKTGREMETFPSLLLHQNSIIIQLTSSGKKYSNLTRKSRRGKSKTGSLLSFQS